MVSDENLGENRCVSCGEIIPEGWQYCSNCYHKIKENELLRNADGYKDPTAYAAYKAIEHEEINHDISKLVKIFRMVAHLSGYEIKGRIVFEDLTNGKIYS